MVKYILCIVMLVVVTAALRLHDPKFPPREERSAPSSTIDGEYTKVACTGENQEREIIIQQSICSVPKDVFVNLEPKFFDQEVSPGSVWVKRCVGLCEYNNTGSCMPTATETRNIPVRLFNSTSRKDACATYPVEEHLSCGCCDLSPDSCTPPMVYNLLECACQSPNMAERRNYLKKVR